MPGPCNPPRSGTVYADALRIRIFFCMERLTYVRPETELLVVAVGQGFAASVESEVEGFDREDWNE